MKSHIGNNRSRVLMFAIGLLSFLFALPMAEAQYFGRNKPSYQRFDFKVYQSPNFEFYHYFDDEKVIQEVAETFEKWYVRHQAVFKDTFDVQNPIIIYANHPDFQQTTAVSGNISIGTQGVTEALRNRVVLPILETNAQTDHVIGHELVHVFHFRALFIDDSLSLNSLRNLDLWLVEGMAEYFSIGSVDTHTAMIMRDAVHQDEFPSLKDMTQEMGKYNPYRYGHAFVSFFGRTWGDSLIVPLYKETGRFGYERAMQRVVGLSPTTVSDLWKASYVNHYKPFLADTTRHFPVGNKILSEENAGTINISPSISPDGKYVAFFSERDLLSIDLFLAETATGKIVRKLSSSTRNMDIDGYNFFESVGSWSPDGKRFVHTAVAKGRNNLVIVDVDNPRRTREIVVKGVPSLNNPAWSPDGRHIVFSGLVGGRPNLYMMDVETEKVTQLTRDHYSYVHPSWSPDGRYLAFSTDRPQTSQLSQTANFHFNLGVMDMQSEARPFVVYDVFPGAENLNPQFSPSQDGLYFLSNSDGFRNLFFLKFDTGKVVRLTDYYTGISGITHLSPALSVARNTGKVVYSHYQKGNYSIFLADPSDFVPVEVDPMHTDFMASTLPPFERPTVPIVDKNLRLEPSESIFPIDSFNEIPFARRFALSYIGNSGVGAATSRFGHGVSGGVDMLFTDIVGDNQMFASLAVNGEIYDFGGQVGYLNQKNKFAWGGSASHIPYPFSYLQYRDDVLNIGGEPTPVLNLQLILQRIFEDQISAFAYYPISTTRRIEAGASLSWYYFRIDAINNYYLQGFLIGQDREKLESPDGFNLQRLNIAYVGDNSFFGMASPITGQRYRFGVEKNFGMVDMYSVTADYRRYINFKPFTLAFRGIHYGRYGKRVQNNLYYPLYLGYPGWIRGYTYNSLYKLEDALDEKFTFDQLQGNRVIMGGIELRVPFTGPERLALIKSNFLFTELAWFADAGVAWDSGTRITLDRDRAYAEGYRFPVFSTGPSLRVNLFGALILEPYYAFPIHTKGIGRGVWGLNFVPGW